MFAFKMKRPLALVACFLLVFIGLIPSVLAATATVSFTAKDDAGRSVKGVKFTLYVDTDPLWSYDVLSDAQGLVKVAGLATGTYTMLINSAPGYVNDGTQKGVFTVNDAGQVSYERQLSDALTLQRLAQGKKFTINDVTGSAVKDAVFNIASSTGDLIDNFRTDEYGILELFLPAGVYTMTNVQVPASHEVSSASLSITVNQDGTYTYAKSPTDTFKLSLSRHTLVFVKKDEAGNGVPGAVFHLSGKQVNATATSDSTGSVTFTGLLSAGDYVLVERSAPTGYTKATVSVTVKVDADGKYTYDTAPDKAFINTRAKYSLSFTMRNDGGAVVAGAKYKLEGGGLSFESEAEIGTGRVLFAEVPFGAYNLTQTTAAEGYPAVKTKVMVTLHAGGGVSYSEDPSEVFLAVRTRYAFSFTAKDEKGTALDGATYTLTGKTKLTEKSQTDGKISFADLLPGKYTLSQASVGAGHTRSTETVVVTVAQDGKVTFSKPIETTIVATIAKFTVSFDKMDDTGAPVPGAIFRLKGTAYEKDIIATKTGKISFQGLLPGSYTLTEITAPQGYTKSSASVTVNVSTNGVVTYSKQPSQTFTNPRSQFAVSFVTVDELGAPRQDATFTLQGMGLSKNSISNRKGLVTFDKLPFGTYSIEQIQAPQGYTKSPRKVEMTLLLSGDKQFATVELPEVAPTTFSTLDGVFVNTAGPISFSFEAVDDDLKPLENAGFALMEGSSGETVLSQSNAVGIAAFYGVAPGKYMLSQSTAPAFYKPSDDMYRVEIQSGGAFAIYQLKGSSPELDGQLIIEDTLVEGETKLLPVISFVSERERYPLQLVCTDTENNVPLAGVLLNITKNPDVPGVASFLTDGKGNAVSAALLPGEYFILPQSVPVGYELTLPDGMIKVTIPKDGQVETIKITAIPLAVPVIAPPEGLLATATDFIKQHLIGVIIAGAGGLLLVGLILLLAKR